VISAGGSNIKTAIVYITKGGATAMYARIVAEVLEAAGHEPSMIDLGKIRKPDLSAFDAVVVGTGVRIGMVYRKGKRFLRERSSMTSGWPSSSRAGSPSRTRGNRSTSSSTRC